MLRTKVTRCASSVTITQVRLVRALQVGQRQDRPCGVRVLPLHLMHPPVHLTRACNAFARELTTRSSYKHTLAMTESGAVFSCGCNAQGQLGVKSTADRVLFDFIPYLQKEDVVSIAAGACHRCFQSACISLQLFGCVCC